MKRIFLLTAAALLLCSGCSWMEGSYVSVTSHQVGYLRTDDEPFVVSSLSQMRSALVTLVDSGESEALLTLVDYPEEQIDTDLKTAVDYVTRVYPIGAYAVREIIPIRGSTSGQETIAIQVRYEHSKSEIRQIRNVRGIEGAKAAIAEALQNFQHILTLQITSYEDTDFQQMIEDYSSQHPDLVMEHPSVTPQIYPDEGSTRILTLKFNYEQGRDQLRKMRETVEPIFASAQLYVTPDAQDAVKLGQLYYFLMQRSDYTVQSSFTPAYSLLAHGVGDSKAFADVYGAMCRQVGLEAMTVSGTCRGEIRFWNIVRCDDTFCHVDLLRGYDGDGFRLYGDREMTDYVWDYSAFPVCSSPLLEQIPETVPQVSLQPNPENPTAPG